MARTQSAKQCLIPGVSLQMAICNVLRALGTLRVHSRINVAMQITLSKYASQCQCRHESRARIDNNRIARAMGATTVRWPEAILQSFICTSEHFLLFCYHRRQPPYRTHDGRHHRAPAGGCQGVRHRQCCLATANLSTPCGNLFADNNRIARATGATIVHRPEEIRESDIGTRAGLFDVRKIGDEFFTFIVDCEVRTSPVSIWLHLLAGCITIVMCEDPSRQAAASALLVSLAGNNKGCQPFSQWLPTEAGTTADVSWLAGQQMRNFTICWQEPKACSVVLRGASKDTLNEVEAQLAGGNSTSQGPESCSVRYNRTRRRAPWCCAARRRTPSTRSSATCRAY